MNKILTLINNETFKKYSFMLVAIILIATFCVAITPVTLQNDTFYSIKIGEDISKYGIDMADHYSWHQNLPYTYPHWLYDLCTYFIYSISNFDGIYLVTCILSCILGIALYLINSKLNNNYVVPFFTTIGVLYLIRGYITARAQLVTFTLFILAIYFIEMFLRKPKIRYVIGLTLISLLIANLHCAVWLFLFVLFLPYIAEYLLCEVFDFWVYRKFKLFRLNIKIKALTNSKKNPEKLVSLQKELDDLKNTNIKIMTKREKDLANPYKIRLKKVKATKWLILIMIVCVLVGFITPNGTTPFTYLAKTMQGNTTENINEHLPVTLANENEIMITLGIILALLIFTKTKIRLCDLCMLCGLTFLMLSSRRQLSLFAIIGSIILTKMLLEFIANNFKGGIEGFNKFFTDLKTIVLVTLLTVCLSYYQAKDKFDDTIIDKETYPVEACNYILENIDLGKARFFNEYNYGSYMLLRGIPVFIDSRADLYSPEFNGLKDDIFMDFIEASNISKFYGDIFDKYNITHVILYKNAKVNMIIEKTDKENYKKLYSDEHFVIYERLNTKN